MVNYDKVTKEKAEIFLKLYKKYLLLKLDDMKYILQTLPSNVIDRCFHSVKFFDDDFDISKLDESTFGVGGLYGCNKIQNLVRELEFVKEYEDKQKLDEFMERYGFKINRKNIGVKGLE